MLFPPQFASADRLELVKLFTYIEFCLTQVVKDNELGALREVRALGAPGTSGGAVCCAVPCRAALHACSAAPTSTGWC